MVRVLAGWILVACMMSSCTSSRNITRQQVKNEFSEAAAQYKVMAKLLPDGRFPKTFENGELKTSGSGWWCSGFYPGSLFYIWQQTKDTVIYNEMQRSLTGLAKEQYNKSTHDIGFMMYCSYGNLQQVQPSSTTAEILMNSAKSLITRFDSKLGVIKSWDGNKKDYLVIIDNMMNLELLMWATRYSGDSVYAKVAITHANTTMKNHFRDDYSSFHVVNYNPVTGEVQQKRTAQGANDTSAWARGQAWGLYGYTVMYRETKDKRYLEQANHIAEFILTNPHLPADKIPYWDYDAPGIPNALRDASAAAIMASAFLELSKYAGKTNAASYFAAAEQMLKSLSAKPYKADAGTNGGFILKHSVGHMPQQTEVDVPLTYADYYYLEALTRYRNY